MSTLPRLGRADLIDRLGLIISKLAGGEGVGSMSSLCIVL
jgi:hypothetical protein